jgi:hypothetical protein
MLVITQDIDGLGRASEHPGRSPYTMSLQVRLLDEQALGAAVLHRDEQIPIYLRATIEFTLEGTDLGMWRSK